MGARTRAISLSLAPGPGSGETVAGAAASSGRARLAPRAGFARCPAHIAWLNMVRCLKCGRRDRKDCTIRQKAQRVRGRKTRLFCESLSAPPSQLAGRSMLVGPELPPTAAGSPRRSPCAPSLLPKCIPKPVLSTAPCAPAKGAAVENDPDRVRGRAVTTLSSQGGRAHVASWSRRFQIIVGNALGPGCSRFPRPASARRAG